MKIENLFLCLSPLPLVNLRLPNLKNLVKVKGIFKGKSKVTNPPVRHAPVAAGSCMNNPPPQFRLKAAHAGYVTFYNQLIKKKKKATDPGSRQRKPPADALCLTSRTSRRPESQHGWEKSCCYNHFRRHSALTTPPRGSCGGGRSTTASVDFLICAAGVTGSLQKLLVLLNCPTPAPLLHYTKEEKGKTPQQGSGQKCRRNLLKVTAPQCRRRTGPRKSSSRPALALTLSSPLWHI